METEEGKKEKIDEALIETKAFDSLEKDFQEVLQELKGNDNLDYFKHEYEKLHRALKKSHGKFPNSLWSSFLHQNSETHH